MCVLENGIREHWTCRYGNGRPIDHMHDTQGTRMEYGSTGMRHWITSNHTIHTLPHTDTREVRSLTLHLYAGGMWNKTEVFKQALSKWEKQYKMSLPPQITSCTIHTSHTTHTLHTTHTSQNTHTTHSIPHTSKVLFWEGHLFPAHEECPLGNM